MQTLYAIIVCTTGAVPLVLLRFNPIPGTAVAWYESSPTIALEALNECCSQAQHVRVRAKMAHHTHSVCAISDKLLFEVSHANCKDINIVRFPQF